MLRSGKHFGRSLRGILFPLASAVHPEYPCGYGMRMYNALPRLHLFSCHSLPPKQLTAGGGPAWSQKEQIAGWSHTEREPYGQQPYRYVELQHRDLDLIYQQLAIHLNTKSPRIAQRDSPSWSNTCYHHPQILCSDTKRFCCLRRESQLYRYPIVRVLREMMECSPDLHFHRHLFVQALQTFFSKSGMSTDCRVKQELFDVFDRNNNNSVDLIELVSGLAQLCYGDREDRIEALFYLYKRDPGGHVIKFSDMVYFIAHIYSIVLSVSLVARYRQHEIWAKTLDDLAYLSVRYLFHQLAVTSASSSVEDPFSSYNEGTPVDTLHSSDQPAPNLKHLAINYDQFTRMCEATAKAPDSPRSALLRYPFEVMMAAIMSPLEWPVAGEQLQTIQSSVSTFL